MGDGFADQTGRDIVAVHSGEKLLLEAAPCRLGLSAARI